MQQVKNCRNLSPYPCAGTLNHSTAVYIMHFLINIRTGGSHNFIQFMFFRTVIFLFSPLGAWMLVTPQRVERIRKSLKAGTEKKDQNKHLTRQGLNVWRAVQQGQPWQQIKQRHKPQFNHRLSGSYCMSVSIQPVEFQSLVFWFSPRFLFSASFQLVRH